MGVYIPNLDEKKFCEICKEHNLDFVAVPVPPHGRLIDADRLEVIAYSGTEGRPDTFDAGVEWAAEQIDKLPTVIPEEET